MKGFATVPTVLIVLGSIMSVSVLGIGVESVMGVEDAIAEEALPMITNRVSHAVYMADSMDEADITLNFRTDFVLEESDGDLFLNTGDSSEMIDPGIRFRYDEDELGEEFDQLCISKSGLQPHLSTGECS